MEFYLIQPFTLGLFACMAGGSFLLPSKMPPLIRVTTGISYMLLGVLLLSTNLIEIGEIERKTLLNIILLAMALSALVANIGAFVVEKLRLRTAKKLDLNVGRRSDDAH